MMVSQCGQVPKSLKGMCQTDLVLNTELEPKLTSLMAEDELAQLFSQVPIESLWIMKHGSIDENDQYLFHSRVAKRFSQKAVTYLASQCWLTSDIPLFKVHLLDASIPAISTGHTYICAYSTEHSDLELIEKTSALFGYWLLWTDELLTPLHKYCIEQQVRALQDRQQHFLVQSQLYAQIQSLKQTLYKTEHQLKTPLSLVELYAEILQQSVPTQPLRAQATHICKTIDEIRLSLKRLTRWEENAQTAHPTCELKQVLTNSIANLRPYLEQKAITIMCEGNSLSLAIDAWQMKQVFHNLLNNAIAFTPVGKTITCQWKVLQTEVLIEICDRGSGFSSEDLANLFTPFYSRRCQGTGLGLVIARDIIQAHQGRLWATNAPHGGALISMTLPRS